MKTILVPIDFSENSINALKYADKVAQKFEAKIILFHVYIGDVSNYEAGWPIQEDFEKIILERKAKLEEIAINNCSTSNQIEIVEGDAVEKIIEATEKMLIDLIIMGTHGASGLKAVLLGSNTSNVISKSNTPVLAIPQHFIYTNIDKIIYASDFDDLENELNAIAPIAKSFGANLEVLHLIYDNSKYQEAEKLFKDLKHTFNDIQITFKQRTILMEESLTEQLKSYVSPQQHALLAMFTQERDWFGKLFLSSKTEELTNKLELPLLSFRKKDNVVKNGAKI
jgi:nucleotide-binding universal stress UspA family protein